MKVAKTRVVDGDSIYVVRKRGPLNLFSRSSPFAVRLYGIDAPEVAQPLGDESRRALDKMTGGTMDLETRNTDRYGRTVGILYRRNGDSINLSMVREGWAYAYRRYGTLDGVVQAEEKAKAAKLGVWRLRRSDTPWDYRRNLRSSAQLRKRLQHVLLIAAFVGGLAVCALLTQLAWPDATARFIATLPDYYDRTANIFNTLIDLVRRSP